jgi:hypothetical protein
MQTIFAMKEINTLNHIRLNKMSYIYRKPYIVAEDEEEVDQEDTNITINSMKDFERITKIQEDTTIRKFE